MTKCDTGARWIRAMALAAAVAGCGGPSTGTQLPAGASSAAIEILNYTDIPQRVTVPPGSVVLLLNRDPFPHTVTSESVTGSHVYGAVNGVAFDTGQFTGSRPLEIPATTPPGTVIPYFCRLHGAAHPDGEIEVAAP